MYRESAANSILPMSEFFSVSNAKRCPPPLVENNRCLEIALRFCNYKKNQFPLFLKIASCFPVLKVQPQNPKYLLWKIFGVSKAGSKRRLPEWSDADLQKCANRNRLL